MKIFPLWGRYAYYGKVTVKWSPHRPTASINKPPSTPPSR